jgi:hypothetical protein
MVERGMVGDENKDWFEVVGRKGSHPERIPKLQQPVDGGFGF